MKWTDCVEVERDDTQDTTIYDDRCGFIIRRETLKAVFEDQFTYVVVGLALAALLVAAIGTVLWCLLARKERRSRALNRRQQRMMMYQNEEDVGMHAWTITKEELDVIAPVKPFSVFVTELRQHMVKRRASPGHIISAPEPVALRPAEPDCDQASIASLNTSLNNISPSSSPNILSIYNFWWQNRPSGDQLLINMFGLNGETDYSCAVCQEHINDEADPGVVVEGVKPDPLLRQLPCRHVFHDVCIVPWVTTRNPSCPLCKYFLVE